MWQHCRGGSGAVGRRRATQGEGKSPAKQRAGYGEGGTDRISPPVLLVPQMGIGQITAQGGFKVTLSPRRPGYS